MSKAHPKKQWYLLNCKPKQDQRAEENLNNQGYTTFRPTIQLPKKRRGKDILIEESLFPRYLFIHLDKEQDNWAPIRSTLGVNNIVRFGEQPAQAPDTLIEHLKQRMLLGENGVNNAPKQTYKLGEKLTIKEGPLQGMDVVFNGYAGDERVIVLLDMLSQQNTVKLPRGSVRKSLAF
ncbi:transcription/translation regulatory transformer protein RfaH [Leucothrix sargassi]|nr:transcription/translation regulatory transformer protein RfaH [Leucothrix sargassi]